MHFFVADNDAGISKGYLISYTYIILICRVKVLYIKYGDVHREIFIKYLSNIDQENRWIYLQGSNAMKSDPLVSMCATFWRRWKAVLIDNPEDELRFVVDQSEMYIDKKYKMCIIY